MTEHIVKAVDFADAISIIETTADYYHSMTSWDSPYWYHNFWAALDLLERIQGLEEGSLLTEHFEQYPDCDCRELN